MFFGYTQDLVVGDNNCDTARTSTTLSVAKGHSRLSEANRDPAAIDKLGKARKNLSIDAGTRKSRGIVANLLSYRWYRRLGRHE